MQRFSGSKPNQAHWLFIILLYVFFIGLGVYFLWDTWKHHAQPMSYGMVLAYLALFSTMGGLSVYVFLNSLTVYEVDDTEIVQRRVFGTRRMRWRDVVEVKEGNTTQESDMVLVDNGGQKLGIQFGMLGNQSAGLYAFISARLETLRARQTDEFAAQERALDSIPRGLSQTLAVLGILLLLTAFALFQFAYDPSLIPAMATLAGCGLLLLPLSAYFTKKRITFSGQEIRVRGLWGEKRLLLHQVESAFLYQDAGQSNRFETLALRGNGVSVKFVSNMPDYPLLRAAVLKNVPPEAIQHGEPERAAYDQRQTREAVTILAVCSTCIVGFAAWGLNQEVAVVQRIEQLAKQGVYTTATITGYDNGGDKPYLTDIEYVFTANGRTYTNHTVHGHTITGDNSLSESHAHLHMNDTVEVCYLPQNPDENRLKILMDWHPLLLPSITMFVPLFATPLLIPGYLWMKKHNQRKADENAAVAQTAAS